MPGRRPFTTLLLALLLGTAAVGDVALAATPLEASRTDAARARESAGAIRARQQALRGELSRLSERIEALKREAAGKIVVGGELNAALQRSQEISTELGGLARALQSAESEGQRKNLRLGELLTEELSRLRQRWERTQSRDERRQLSEQMRALRTERDGLQAALPAGIQLPPLETPDTDDARDLHEQADTLRDSEDKLRRQMKALEGRIREVKQEREMDRRMSEFMGDEALFDESDRRLRIQRSRSAASSTEKAGGEAPANQETATPAPANAPGPAPAETAPEPSPNRGDDSSPSTPAGMEGPAPLGAPTGSSTPQPAPVESPPPTPSGGGPPGGGSGTSSPVPVNVPATAPTQLRGIDSRPRVGHMDEALLLDLDTQNLGVLEKQLARMRQAAEAYRKRADELEKKARTLDSP